MKRESIEVIRLFPVKLLSRVEFLKIGLSNNHKRKNSKRPSLALENGFCFLLENGKKLLLEKEGTKTYPVISKAAPSLCLENGYGLLLEGGGKIILEPQ